MRKRLIKLFYDSMSINIELSLVGTNSILDFEIYETFHDSSFERYLTTLRVASDFSDFWYKSFLDGFSIDSAHSNFVKREEII